MVEPTRSSGSLRGRLATLAGAAGAVAVGAGEAKAVPYTPTAGVVAAQGIPGFLFVSDTNVTLGSLRPPENQGFTSWDVDGSGGADFQLSHVSSGPVTGAAFIGINGGERLVETSALSQRFIDNLGVSFTVDAQASYWTAVRTSLLTLNGNNNNGYFTTGIAGEFGFRFTDASDTYYGWGSLVIDVAAPGFGFKITEAYYNSTPGAAIEVGQVPVAVPEPSSIALLALGSAGVFAWRARRKAK